jgi:hypothetical protein
VGDLDDGRAFRVELFEKLHDLAALVGMEITGGLVREDERGFGDECPGHADELLLSAGKLRGTEVLFPDDA